MLSSFIRPFDFGDNPGAFNIFSTDGDHGSTAHQQSKVTNSQQILKQEKMVNSGSAIDSNQSSGVQITPLVIT